MVAAVAFGALFVRDPRRALWGLAWGLAAMFLLAEFFGVRPGMAVGAIVTALVALSGRRARAAPTLPEDSALDHAWVRLGQVGGFWSRNRIVTGPGLPSPTGRPSIVTMGRTKFDALVRKASAAS